VPGFAWGVIVDGELVARGGGGTRCAGEDARPDADTVFRIASMTKSFTASTLLLLRDEGRLSLDDPVARWVPDVADLRTHP
jgi:CubicO group peptidase (beta-lactamase class C family)